jgi:hypothetical protein
VKWIACPMALYATQTVGFIVCLAMLLLAQRGRLRERRRREQERLRHEMDRKETAESLLALRGSLDRLRAALEEERRPVGAAQFSVIAGASMNLNKRGEALRLHRRGESAEHIAAALQVPRGEVNLLLKVQRLLTADS